MKSPNPGQSREYNIFDKWNIHGNINLKNVAIGLKAPESIYEADLE